ncbi:hypothetical protein JJE66_15000 [Bradyrhizobium diazoefficiens]|uniref:hypothetical protein n=1 Tax=Bradyrhizobium diazoefficiens TaxID=1355477 RepID=UPI001909A66C|nr:hypothetical protein [Bradyrhizobium diazoefficiens]MBK3662550.1 hypothetical protein [Bradyrhizobium diazoefficiens]
MPFALRLALAMELVLLLLEKVLPQGWRLPLFGDHFTQAAVLIIAAVIYVEFKNLLNS